MCWAFAVSPSGYYDWRDRLPSERVSCRTKLDVAVKLAFWVEKGRAGAPRLSKRLKANGCNPGRIQVAESLRRQGLRAKAGRKFKTTINLKHSLPIAPNLLEQGAERASQKWVSDITCIATDEDWLYLAVAVDLYSRLAVGPNV